PRVSAAVKETCRFSWATNVAAKQLEEHRADITRTARDNAKAAAEDIAKDVTPKIANALGVTAATASAVLHPLVPLAGAAVGVLTYVGGKDRPVRSCRLLSPVLPRG